MNSESPEALSEVLAVLAAEREITRVLYRYYVDRFEKRSGEWRIAHRKLLRSWEKVEPARALDGGVAVPDPAPRTDGLRTREDLS
jgi:hypothetical protein